MQADDDSNPVVAVIPNSHPFLTIPIDVVGLPSLAVQQIGTPYPPITFTKMLSDIAVFGFT